MTKPYVIIGGGVAAVHAAKAIRDRDEVTEIIIFGEENHLPYSRIKLTKGLFTDLHSEKVLIKKEKWYLANRITVCTSTRVVALRPDLRQIETEDGRTWEYGKLLLCMGARNRAFPVPGAGLHGVHSIRDMKDADTLKSGLTSGSRVAVIGGGVQGLETAWALREAGYAVTVIEASPRLMARQLDRHSSERLRLELESSGVTVRLHSGVAAIEGTGSVQGIRLEDGSQVPCDHVVYSIGIQPNTSIVKDTDLEVRNGIVVNDRLETSIAGIYAAGDVAELNGHVEGLWGGALEQGRTAGFNMAADDQEVYVKAVPVTLFNAFGISLFSIGTVDEDRCDLMLTGEQNGVYTAIFVKENTIIGAVSWEGAAASLSYKEAVERKIGLEGMNLAGMDIASVMDEVKSRLSGKTCSA
ncbi:NAD(P)/FAD-dependent oxidoreductase [Paenibacillus rhizophilus]|uniref:NAD(P)/FAD-dependent oxidoreductase n=1 Tax=Paenibacillus rhizophilus TaxID=1850366 RepID=A0A3N9NY85_9BACL|nr:FAD-dependent oxidoreductase [Paenibacillus rhizophilus]RQW08359.1 NAD(P)/FAD-dependent oxidoreductase [Paenibacillus rhizophilus]